MGWMASWIAVQGQKEAVLEALSLEEDGERAEPGGRAGQFRFAALPGNWCVVLADDFDWASPQRVRDVSSVGLAVGCQFEDKVEMTSAAFAARGGVELWRVFHNSVKSIYRLDVSGKPPAELAAIRKDAFKQQDDHGGEASSADFVHDVPMELAKVVCGFRHDEPANFVLLRRSGVGEKTSRPRLSFVQKLLAPLRPRPWDNA